MSEIGTPHVIVIGQRTLRLLAQGETVTVTSPDGSCLVTFIHASDFPNEAILAATEGNPDAI